MEKVFILQLGLGKDSMCGDLISLNKLLENGFHVMSQTAYDKYVVFVLRKSP